MSYPSEHIDAVIDTLLDDAEDPERIIDMLRDSIDVAAESRGFTHRGALDTNDFVHVDAADVGPGYDVNCYTQDGDRIRVSHNLTEGAATEQAEAIASALKTWEGWA